MTMPNENMFPPAEPGLDQVVRTNLERTAGETDAAAMLHRLQARLRQENATPVKPRPRWKRWSVLTPLAIAASLIIGFFLLRPGPEVQAEPAQMIEEAKKVHSSDVDRGYRVYFAFSDEMRKRLPHLPPEREETLWTRGDRFRIEPAFGTTGSWGRDEQGNVWWAPTEAEGAVFPAAGLPPLLDEFFAVRSLQLPRLLDEVLQNCELSYLPDDPKASAKVKRIQAIPKAITPMTTLKSAIIEVDRESHVVQKLVLERRFRNVDVAVITFSRIDSIVRDPSFYRIEGALQPGVQPIAGDDEISRLARLKMLKDQGLLRMLSKLP